MYLARFMERYRPLVRDELSRCLNGVEHAALKLAMGHLLGRGKLLRPLLVLAAYEASCGDGEAGVGAEQRSARNDGQKDGRSAAPPLLEESGDEPSMPLAGGVGGTQEMVPYAAPFELIHTFTLIHDDLPCMDDADLRRGVQAVHLAAGEATAVLAGDALLNLAFWRLAVDSSPVGQAAVPAGSAPQAGPPAPPDLMVTAEQRLRLVQCAARATHLVVEGQVLDLEGEGRRLTLDELKRLHNRKTGALLAACCQAGGILASCSPGLCDALWDAGVQLGLVFQIRDDLLSVTGDEAAVGKSLSADEEHDKATYPRLLGVAEAEAMLERELARCREMISAAGLSRPELLLELADLAAHRDR